MGGYSSSDNSSSGNYDFRDDVTVTKRSAASYAKDDKRDYKAPSLGLAPPVDMEISTSSRLSAILLLDQTGSMGKSPQYIIDKMPTMYAESNAAIQGKQLSALKSGEKLEDKLDMAIIAIGDARNNEAYPLQVTDYAKGGKLVKAISKVYPEGNGGGNGKESYDLGLYFALKHANPKKIKGIKPLLVIVGDEGFYEDIRASEVKKYTGDKLSENLKTAEVIKELIDKYDVYMLRPEIGNYGSSTYDKIHQQWQEVLGNERVLKMQGEYKRLVDCFIGICGFAADNFSEAENFLKRRQEAYQVDDVLATLHPLLSSKKPAKKSTVKTKKNDPKKSSDK